MNEKYEKIITPIILFFMLGEALLAAYLTYALFGLWVMFGAALSMLVLLGLVGAIIDKLYEPTSKDDLAIKEKARFAAFYRALPFIVSFPLRAVIIYFLYVQFEHGVLYILLYLLLLIQKHQAALDVTSSLADETYHKLNYLSDKLKSNKD